MSQNRTTYKEWTKSEIKYLINNWDKKKAEELEKELCLESRSQLNSMVSRLRKEGFDLPSKTAKGRLIKIIDEIKKEKSWQKKQKRK